MNYYLFSIHKLKDWLYKWSLEPFFWNTRSGRGGFSFLHYRNE